MPKLTSQKSDRYWWFASISKMEIATRSTPHFIRSAGKWSLYEQTVAAVLTPNRIWFLGKRSDDYRTRGVPLTSGAIALDDWYLRYAKVMVHENIELYRRKVQGFAHLPRGWDTHGAGPISLEAIADALRLLYLLEKNHIVPNAAIPTSDESVLIRYESGLKTFKWEFAGNGEIAFVKTEADGKREYVDVPPNFTELPV